MPQTNIFSSFLVIQTAFIGDVILATGLVENIRASYPEASIDFLVRKGNETLLQNNPHIREILVLNKKQNKYRNIWNMMSRVRKNRYDAVINVQRFATSGLIAAYSGARYIAGFDKNPFSWFFTQKVVHRLGEGIHETRRNHELITPLTNERASRPVLYPSQSDFEVVSAYKKKRYICIAPTSVWYTKQFPADGWVGFIRSLAGKNVSIYLLGGKEDAGIIDGIITASPDSHAVNLAGKLSLLQSAALMRDAVMNYVNDSAPMHMASAMNAPVTAVFCSTVPDFGFGPLSDISYVVETKEKLTCRPCGNHGKKACPDGHFKCGKTIGNDQLLSTFQNQENH